MPTSDLSKLSPTEILGPALQQLVEKDADLLDRDVHEVAVCSRLQHYLANRFEGFDNLKVDIEYDKEKDNTKKSDPRQSVLPFDFFEQLGEVAFIPDILIHKRGDHLKNRLVVEVKKKENKHLQDKIKDLLKCLLYAAKPFEYNYAVYLEIDPGKSKLVSEAWMIKCSDLKKNYNELNPYAIDLLEHYQRAFYKRKLNMTDFQSSLYKIKKRLFNPLSFDKYLNANSLSI